MVHWLFFTVSVDAALVILLLYWGLLYHGGPVSGVNANTHLVNGIVAIIDFWVCGLPVHFLHFIYPVAFGSVYAVFIWIYFATPSSGPIYEILDYEEATDVAIVVVLCCILILLIVHVFFFVMYMGKAWILNRIMHYCGHTRMKSKGQQTEWKYFGVV